MLNKIVQLGISNLEAETLIKENKNISLAYKKLKKGYPIQYLIGYVNFYGYNIKINKKVLIPRFETETLVEKVIKYIKKYKFIKPSILDLCTGSGCISISLSKELNLRITASDISKSALKIARTNIKDLNANVVLIHSNLFKHLNGKYDIIVSNPPYVSKSERLSKVVKYEPKKALYSQNNGMFLIKKIIKESSRYLSKKSLLAIEIGEKQGDVLKKYALTVFPNSKVKIEKDMSNRDRYLFILNNCE